MNIALWHGSKPANVVTASLVPRARLDTVHRTGKGEKKSRFETERRKTVGKKAMGGGLSFIFTSMSLLTCVNPRLKEEHAQAT